MVSKRMRWIGGLLALWFLVLGGCSTLDEQQRKWIFQPSKDNWGGATAAADGMQDRWIEFTPPGADAPVKLHALWLPCRPQCAGDVVSARPAGA